MYNGLVKSVRHIQVKQISFHPKLFEAIITYQPHPTEFDESDELEYQKQLMNDVVCHNWFMTDRGKRLLLSKNNWGTNVN